MDICEQIANKRQQQLDAEQAQRDKLAAAFDTLIKEFRNKLPQLRKAERIFRTLQKNDYIMLTENMYLNREDHYKKGYFLSDGWFHWPGFDHRFDDVYFTRGGGACRFSCGINLITGQVLVSESEFGTPSTALADNEVKKMCKTGGYYSTNEHKLGRNYQLTGKEIVSKLNSCFKEADRFCARVAEFAQKVVNG